MILGALADYYETLAKAGEISRPGYCRANVSFALNLKEDGTLIGVMPLKTEAQRGKKTVEVSQRLEVPEQVKKSVNVKANFLSGNSGYVLGIDNKGKPERTRQCFDAFRKQHHDVLDGVDSPAARAVLTFLDAWRPDEAADCAAIADDIEALTAGGNIIFKVAGYGNVHEDAAVRRAWEAYKAGAPTSPVMQCLITGQETPIARLHANIKGVKYGKPTGVSIVAFQQEKVAFSSYGRDEQQGLNAPVSEYAAFAYTTALNHLLADAEYKQTFGDTTVVYWAQSPERIYPDMFRFSINPVPEENGGQREIVADKGAQRLVGDIFVKLLEGIPVDDFRDAFDPKTRFYVLGLAPNASRLSIRFFLENDFGRVMENIKSHYNALEIERSPKDFRYLPLWKLMQETVSPKSRNKASSPLLSGATLRAIFSDQPYPEAFYNSVMIRIKADHDISRGKAAIIKACLTRSHNEKYKEVLTVSLNEQSNNKAYILGRLFAALEKAQTDANPSINATIKDRYFASACAAPSSVFPVLLRLAGHHTSKSEYGYVSELRIREIMDKLDVENNPFPAHLGLPDQGVFILGYYHQMKANYAKKNKEENENDDSKQV